MTEPEPPWTETHTAHEKTDVFFVADTLKRFAIEDAAERKDAETEEASE